MRTFTQIIKDAPKPHLDDSTRLNDYSQNGEAKIVTTWLNRIAEEDGTLSISRWCVEFGAGDGIQDSNTRHLTEYFDYKAILIEADKVNYARLERNVHPDSVAFYKKVTPTGENSLDSILASTACPKDFDFLSIDIDSYDYLVWEHFVDYQPKIVCIEFNHTISPSLHIRQEIEGPNFGASLSAIADLGLSKGYHLVDATICNAVFVHSKYTSECKEIEQVWKSKNSVTSIFFGYDRQPHFSGPMRAPWTEIAYNGKPHFNLMTEKELIQAYKEGISSHGGSD